MTIRLPTIAAGVQFAIGLALIVVPFAVGLPGRSRAASDMIADFEPVMTPSEVRATRGDLDRLRALQDDFVPVVTPEAVVRFQAYLRAMEALYGDLQAVFPGLAARFGMTPEQFQAYLGQTSPGLTQGLQTFPTMEKDFAGVVDLMATDVDLVQGMPGSVGRYDDLVSKMERNVGHFDQAKGMPIDLMPWLFVGPGVVIALMAALQLGWAGPGGDHRRGER